MKLTTPELTDSQIERIDEIQSRTHDYINSLLPEGVAEIEWDSDLIDRVLTAVWEGLEDKGVCSEMEFYPYEEWEAVKVNN